MFNQMIRLGVFETNSSSAHVFIIHGKPDEMLKHMSDYYNEETGTLYIDTLYDDSQGIRDEFSTTSEKLNYLMEDLLNYNLTVENIKILIEFFPNLKNICLDGVYIPIIKDDQIDLADLSNYIENANIGCFEYGKLEFNKTNLINIVFNPNATIYIGNDDWFYQNYYDDDLEPILISDEMLNLVMTKYNISNKQIDEFLEKRIKENHGSMDCMKSNFYRMLCVIDLCQKHEIVSDIAQINNDIEEYLIANQNK